MAYNNTTLFGSSYLPQINPTRTAIKIGCGAMLWLTLRSTVYYGVRGLISKYILNREDGLQDATIDGVGYVTCVGAEYAVSCMWCPVPFLAGITAPRYLLDYVLTWFSEYVCVFDRFNAAEYAAFSVYAFEGGEEEWNFAFFTWQTPSVLLTLGKLMYRRLRYGSKSTNALRVLGVLGLQVLVRAFLSSFSILLPDSSSSALQAIIFVFLDSAASRYLIWRTFPRPPRSVDTTLTD